MESLGLCGEVRPAGRQRPRVYQARLGFPVTALAIFLVRPPFLARVGKSFLEQKLYLLIQ